MELTIDTLITPEFVMKINLIQRKHLRHFRISELHYKDKGAPSPHYEGITIEYEADAINSVIELFELVNFRGLPAVVFTKEENSSD